MDGHIVDGEMMELPSMVIIVLSDVMMVMSKLVVIVCTVRVMGDGVVLRLFVKEVRTVFRALLSKTNYLIAICNEVNL